jgi:hypothetical protein
MYGFFGCMIMGALLRCDATRLSAGLVAYPLRFLQFLRMVDAYRGREG